VSTKPKLNNKLINCVLEHIEHEVALGTEKYNQNNWGVIDWDKVDKAVKEGEDTEVNQTMCGTSACFAGWACMLSTPLKEWRKIMGRGIEWHNEGQKRLGLTGDESALLFGGTDAHGGKRQLEIIKLRLKVIRESRERGVPLYQHSDYEDCEG
jgi:hypothetical protein